MSAVTVGGPRVLTLPHNVAWNVGGNAVYAGSQWGLLVLLAKLGSPLMVGQFALGIAVVTPVMMFANLQLRGVQATDALQRTPFGTYLGLRLVTTALALAALALAGLLHEGFSRLAAVVGAIALGKAFEALSDVCYGACQQRERMDLIARSLMAKGLLSLVGMGGAIALTHDLVLGVCVMASVSAVVALGYDVPNARALVGSFKPHFVRRPLLSLARFALPLGLVYLLTSLGTNVPRYFVAHQLGDARLGIFSALAYLTVVSATFVGALGQAASPGLARLYAQGRPRAFGQDLVRLAGISGGLGLLGWLVAFTCGQPLLATVYGPAYAPYASVFVWLMAAGAVGNVAAILGYGMTASRAFKAQVPLFGLVLAVMVLGCAAWVPGNGLAGAAGALLVGALVQAIGSAWVVWRSLARSGHVA